jgi:hypothetical protein
LFEGGIHADSRNDAAGVPRELYGGADSLRRH